MTAIKWTELSIARALALQFFNRKYLAVVPNCNWTGYECDMLCVTENLRLIDVEIKISRADLKADAKKEKWWHKEFKGYGPREPFYSNGRESGYHQRAIYERTAREWPVKVWKHYYALPADIWKPELLDSLPSKSSGVILLREGRINPATVEAYIERRATPSKDAKPISAEAAIDIARLASLRMWDSYRQLEELRRTTLPQILLEPA